MQKNHRLVIGFKPFPKRITGKLETDKIESLRFLYIYFVEDTGIAFIVL